MEEPQDMSPPDHSADIQQSSADGLSALQKRIQGEIGQWLIGQEKTVSLMFNALLTDGHVLLEGVPGVGKTFAARLFAQVLESAFTRIQFTPDLMPSDILGTQIYNQKTGEFMFRPGRVFTNVLMIDEINRAPAKTQAALFEVMQEQQVSIDGETHLFSDPFMVIATQNPVEQEGTYALPEAQLDRFAYRIDMGYPGADDELQMLLKFKNLRKAMNTSIPAIIQQKELSELKLLVPEVFISDEVLMFIRDVIRSTRENKQVYLGASPRAAMVLMKGAQANALMSGRTYVIPEDVVDLLVPVLGHRLVLSAEAEMEGYSVAAVMEDITRAMEIPR